MTEVMHSRTIEVEAFVDCSADTYATGESIGSLLTFNLMKNLPYNFNSGIIQKVVLVDYDAQDAKMDLFLFRKAVTGGVDVTAYAPAVAELAECMGTIPIAAADYADAGTNGDVATVKALGFAFALANGVPNIYGQMVSRGTPTYSDDDMLSLRLTILVD